MSDLFAIYIHAVRRRPHIWTPQKMVVRLAFDEVDAERQGRNLACGWWPKAKGWGDHRVSAMMFDPRMLLGTTEFQNGYLTGMDELYAAGALCRRVSDGDGCGIETYTFVNFFLVSGVDEAEHRITVGINECLPDPDTWGLPRTSTEKFDPLCVGTPTVN